MDKTNPKAHPLVKALHPKQFQGSTCSFIQSVCVQITLKLIMSSLDQPRKETSMQLSNLNKPTQSSPNCQTVVMAALLSLLHFSWCISCHSNSLKDTDIRASYRKHMLRNCSRLENPHQPGIPLLCLVDGAECRRTCVRKLHSSDGFQSTQLLEELQLWQGASHLL